MPASFVGTFDLGYLEMDDPAGPKRVSHPLVWVPEFLVLTRKRLRTQGRVLGAAVLVGVVAGLGAVVFSAACHVVVHFALDRGAGYRAATPSYEATLPWLTDTDTPLRPWLLPLVAAAGGLISGLLVFTVAPEAEGHGTDAAIAAYHHGRSIRPRVPLVKLIASAITIGTGGSGGREGPIAQIGAGFGSLLGKLMRFRPHERRVLLAAGMGAGVAAIFRAPLAGTLFAAEIMYSSPEFEAEVILPTGLASVTAYCTFGLFFGWHPLFLTPPLEFDNPWQLAPYLLLALFVAFLAMLYTRTFYAVTRQFRRWKVPAYAKTMIGAFLSGLIGVTLYYIVGRNQLVLSVLSFGYGALQQSLTQPATVTAVLLLAVALGKILTTSLTIGSGGSGGVFGPSMVIGGCGGGALGLFLHAQWPALVPRPESFVILGMAGFFAAAAKTPFSTLVIVSEMTGDYRLILPALWVCTIAYLVSDEQSLYASQVARRSLSPAHQGAYVRDVLAGIRVEQFLRADAPLPLLRPSDPVAAVIERMADSPYTVLPVVDADRRLLGVVNLEEVHRAAVSADLRPWLLAEDLKRTCDDPLLPGDRLDEALEAFVANDLLALPVVDDAKARKVVGVVRRAQISGEYLRRVHGPAGDAPSSDESAAV
jgi:CIC family chloride channel protein